MVLEVPEAATMMMKGGCFIQTSSMSFAQAVKFQISLMQMQMHLEDVFIDIGINSGQPCVVLMDRGVMDGSAYTSPKIWKAILNETGWTTIQLRDRRYDAVIHLVTAADGAEEFYGKNNEARYESIEQAKQVDSKLINAWTGHPHFKIIDNRHEGGFKAKIQALLKIVIKHIGLPDTAFVQMKFLLMQDGEGRFIINEPSGLKRETFEVEEVFLITRGEEEIESKIRSRGKEDTYTYIHESKTVVKGEEIIRKRQISAREFIQLMDQKDSNTQQVEKIRHCFIYKNQNFVVDVFQNLEGSPTILRIETDNKTEKVSF
jgi:CYTH domain-containing protein